MIWIGRALTVLVLIVTACSTPNFFPREWIEISPSGAPDDDLNRLYDLAARQDFVRVPLGRHQAETADGPVSLLQAYEFRGRRSLRLTIGREPRRDRYVVVLEDTAHGGLDFRGLECRKYLEIVADITAVFGADRMSPAALRKCDPTATSD